ncbi:MAG TPA: DUF3822 family protein [Chitinophagaceae bacterium]|jgi:hypothetical protein
MKRIYEIGNSDELDPAQAVLLIETGETHCCFAIVDYANFMIVQSGFYTAEKNDNNDILKMIIDEHEELQHSFRQTIVGYYTPENITVPSKYYRYEETQNMVKSIFDKGQNIVVSESVPEWQLYNVYNVPAAAHGLLSRRFATGNFWHSYSIILKNRFEQKEEGNVLVDFKTDSFIMIAIKNHALELAQIFPYTQATDVLYWLLKTCKELSILQSEVKLTVSGLVDKQSAVFKELYQYFSDIEFATIENAIQLSGDFESFPVHYFSSFYKLATCVS